MDPDQRREAVVEALFRVIERDGLEQASLRNVAAEAGLAIGSVRHYFEHHTELVVFAMKALSERLTTRLTSHVDRVRTAADPRGAVVDMLAELLPVDERRTRETAVWLAFLMASRTRPELRPHADELYDGLVVLTTRILEGARRGGRLTPDADLALESRRLCALIDGLSLHAILHPDRLDAAAVLDVLRRHLDTLVAPA